MSQAPSRGLKIAVFSMGIALLGGFVLLVALAYAKYQHKPGKTSTLRQASSSCHPSTLSLPSAADYQFQHQEGSLLTLHISQPGQDNRVLTVDLCDGSITHTLAIIQ